MAEVSIRFHMQSALNHACVGAVASAHLARLLLPPQIALLSYQYWLVRCANYQHMKRFSVFLALPSAAIRIMATRQMMVSDGAVPACWRCCARRNLEAAAAAECRRASSRERTWQRAAGRCGTGFNGAW